MKNYLTIKSVTIIFSLKHKGIIRDSGRLNERIFYNMRHSELIEQCEIMTKMKMTNEKIILKNLWYDSTMYRLWKEIDQCVILSFRIDKTE